MEMKPPPAISSQQPTHPGTIRLSNKKTLPTFEKKSIKPPIVSPRSGSAFLDETKVATPQSNRVNQLDFPTKSGSVSSAGPPSVLSPRKLNTFQPRTLQQTKPRRATDFDISAHNAVSSNSFERPPYGNKGPNNSKLASDSLRADSSVFLNSQTPRMNNFTLARGAGTNLNDYNAPADKTQLKSGQNAINRGRNMLKTLSESPFASLSRNLKNTSNISDSDSVTGSAVSEPDSNSTRLSSSSLKVGDAVFVDSLNEKGVLKYLGEIGAKPGIWAGVELDLPNKGKNDGSALGVRYFECEPKKGIFVLATKLKRIYTEDLVYGSATSSSDSVNKNKTNIANDTATHNSVVPSSRNTHSLQRNFSRQLLKTSSSSDLKARLLQNKNSGTFNQAPTTSKNDSTGAFTRNRRPKNKVGVSNIMFNNPAQTEEHSAPDKPPSRNAGAIPRNENRPGTQNRQVSETPKVCQSLHQPTRPLLNYKNSFDITRPLSPNSGLDRLEAKERQEIELLVAENQMLKLENAHSKAQLAVGQYFSQDLGIDFLGDNDISENIDDDFNTKTSIEAKANAAMLEIELLKQTLQNERESFSSRISELEQTLIEKVSYDNIKSMAKAKISPDEDNVTQKLTQELEQTQEILAKVSQSAEDNSQLAKESQLACKHLESFVAELELKLDSKAEDYNRANAALKEIADLISNLDAIATNNGCEPWLQDALFDPTIDYKTEDLFTICKHMVAELSDYLNRKTLETKNSSQKNRAPEPFEQPEDIHELKSRLLELENVNQELTLELGKSSEQTLMFNEYIGRLEMKSNTLLDDIEFLRAENISLKDEIAELTKTDEYDYTNAQMLQSGTAAEFETPSKGHKTAIDTTLKEIKLAHQKEIEELTTQMEKIAEEKDSEILALTEELNEMEAMFESKIFTNTELEYHPDSSSKMSLVKSTVSSSGIDPEDDEFCVLCNNKGHPILNCPTLNPPDNS